MSAVLHLYSEVYRSLCGALAAARGARHEPLIATLETELDELTREMGYQHVQATRGHFGLDSGADFIPLGLRPSVAAFAVEIERKLTEATDLVARGERRELEERDYIHNACEYLESALSNSSTRKVWQAAQECLFALDAAGLIDADEAHE